MYQDKSIKPEANRKMFLGLSAASTAVLFGAIGLVTISLISMRAIDSAQMADIPNNLLRNQIIYSGIGLIVMMIIMRIPYLKIGESAYPLFGLTLLLLLSVLIFGYLGRYISFLSNIFPNINGSYRWIRLGFFSIQPSEFIKITYVLGLAMYLRYRKNYRNLKGLLGPFALTLLPMMLILLEPDLGTVMLLIPVLMIMLYAAGAKIRHLATIVILIIISIPILFAMMKPYQRSRVAGVILQSQTTRDWLAENPRVKNYLYPDKKLNQWHNSLAGYHLYHSKVTIGTGGIWGCGFGKGPYLEGSKRLPECHNDFVFSIIAHQFGLVGSAAIILLYLVMATGLVEIASKTSEPLGRLIAVGFLALLFTQAGINIGMTLGLMPITGVTLPFVSYGGSSMLTFFILVGLVLSVDNFRPIHIAPKPFEFEDDE